MVDLKKVCCMCGDVGFQEKLFRCSNCSNRFQHSYCSNYYSEHAEPIEVCDWCQCEATNSSSVSSFASNLRSNKYCAHANYDLVRSPYSGDKIKQHRSGTMVEKPTGKAPSPRPTARRYKLLKDVMC